MIKFYDPESGDELNADTILSEKFVGEQKWVDVEVDGVRWAVPIGWPNNCSPICEESEPEAYAKLFGTIE